MKTQKRLRASDVKSAIDLPTFYQNETGSVGRIHGVWQVAGLCPFHADTKPGSLNFHRETGRYLCFACDAKGTDVIDFLVNRDSSDFKTVLEYLAQNYGGGIS